MRTIANKTFDEIALGEDTKADPLTNGRAGGSLEHQAVMTRFFQPAQVERVALLRTHRKTDDLGVKAPARGKVAHREDDVTGARDVERRIIDG